MTTNKNITYIDENIEVVLTGRTAKRTIPKRSTRGTDRVQLMYEIRPKDIEQGSWTKWVQLDKLYQVDDNE